MEEHLSPACTNCCTQSPGNIPRNRARQSRLPTSKSVFVLSLIVYVWLVFLDFSHVKRSKRSFHTQEIIISRQSSFICTTLSERKTQKSTKTTKRKTTLTWQPLTSCLVRIHQQFIGCITTWMCVQTRSCRRMWSTVWRTHTSNAPTCRRTPHSCAQSRWFAPEPGERSLSSVTAGNKGRSVCVC